MPACLTGGRASVRMLRAHHRRRRQAARVRTLPFNLKAGGRAPCPALAPARKALAPRWLGPWASLGPRGHRPPLGVIAAHALGAWRLWVAAPAAEAPCGGQAWLSAALRGLTGRASLKLRYKGKSFRWHRRRGSLLLRFGHSHLVTCLPPRETRWRKHGKAKMVFFHTNLTRLREFLLGVVAWREPNRYHGRGLRLSRQRLMIKAGKVSAYR